MSKGPRELVREEILGLKGYAVPSAIGMVKLDAMENPYELPSALAAAMGERLAAVAVNRYPDPRAAGLKAALRKAMAVPDGLEVILGNGSDELIQIVSLALARPGAAVLSLEPSFVMYRLSALAAGMAYHGVALREDFSLDEAALLAAMERIRPALVWIAYPNNPSGNLFAREAILRIVAAAPGVVVVDEAYHAFSEGATLMGEAGRHPNLIVLRTVSKLGLAGLRLGLAAGAAPWIEQFEKLRPPYNVNALTAAAAEFLLGHLEVLEGQALRIVAERARLEGALDRMPALRRFPSSANFILVRVPDAPRAFEGLGSRGILVKSLHGSHPLLDHCLRLTVGTPEENTRVLEALASILAPPNA
ncbi:MAG TPA: histidinol-phosphate transaminase [Usitatibacter sp.]|nr:histidinol-phosphate transaminase [Usitatibacter sp.]